MKNLNCTFGHSLGDHLFLFQFSMQCKVTNTWLNGVLVFLCHVSYDDPAWLWHTVRGWEKWRECLNRQSVWHIHFWTHNKVSFEFLMQKAVSLEVNNFDYGAPRGTVWFQHSLWEIEMCHFTAKLCFICPVSIGSCFLCHRLSLWQRLFVKKPDKKNPNTSQRITFSFLDSKQDS